MRAPRTWRWLTALLLGTGLGGCKSSSARPYPPDPLLVSKRPVEVKAKSTPPATVAATAPVTPPSRADLIAANTATPDDRPTPEEPPLPPRLRPVSAEPARAVPAGQPPSSPAVRASSE